MINNDFLAIYETSHIVFYINDDTLLFAFNRSNGFIFIFMYVLSYNDYFRICMEFYSKMYLLCRTTTIRDCIFLSAYNEKPSVSQTILNFTLISPRMT